MELEFPFGTFRPVKQDYLLRCSVAPLTTQKVVFHLLSTRIFRKVFVNGKEPACTWTQNMQLVFLWSTNFTFSKWPLQVSTQVNGIKVITSLSSSLLKVPYVEPVEQ